MYAIPEWIKQLDSIEKVIAFLRFTKREDLIMKLETQGFLYVSELLEVPKQDDTWSIDCNPDDFIDFIDFEKEAP